MELLQIEKELAGADSAKYLKLYDDRLVALDGRLKAALASGLLPEEFVRCDGLSEAITVARKLLRLQVRE